MDWGEKGRTKKEKVKEKMAMENATQCNEKDIKEHKDDTNKRNMSQEEVGGEGQWLWDWLN